MERRTISAHVQLGTKDETVNKVTLDEFFCNVVSDVKTILQRLTCETVGHVTDVTRVLHTARVSKDKRHTYDKDESAWRS